MRLFSAFLATTSLAAAPGLAQGQPAPVPETQQSAADADEAVQGDHLHDGEEPSIVVTAPLRDLDLLSGTSVLTGDELIRDLRPQLGETLVRLPGVSATSFSPGASRPVLRGFQGERVRVLTDGLGSLDVSNTSADHAVTIDPITAARIEVLKGPAVLLFGSQAIGGAVNVLDRRIPREIPDEAAHVDVLATYGSAADERSIAAGVDAPLGKGGLVVHFDGSFRKTDDQRVGGFVLSDELRAEQAGIAAEELAEGHEEEAAEALELSTLRGRIPNTATEQKTLGAGLALIREGGSLGVSVGWFDSRYGIPSRPGLEHHHEEEGEEGEEGEEAHEGHGHEDVTIGLEQIRFDVRGSLNLGDGLFKEARVRAGYSDYEHTEFEAEEVGTVFTNKGVEGRFELVQNDRGKWSGASGAQYFHRDFSAVGAEAFLPPNKTSQYGLFTLQSFDFGAVSVEGALRYEHSRVSSDTEGVRRNFNAFSGAVGASYEPAPGVKIGANLSHAQRAPSAEELLSNGPHVASQSFEVGDPDLKKERSWGGEVYVRAERGPFEFSASLFASRFANYIYQAFTGAETDELPVLQYFQDDARYWGFEATASAQLFKAAGFQFVADAVTDYVRATVDNSGPAPRIPPFRFLTGIEGRSNKIDARLEAEFVAAQERIAPFENPTEGFTMVNASVEWRPGGKRSQSAFILSANNIFDVDARRHASLTREFSPLAGRDVRLSARVSF
ncbi:MAG TPA: TonB-dependent receptor [Allosphingosinicella sp.]|jgi:iron complex outermembrane receptor protein